MYLCMCICVRVCVCVYLCMCMVCIVCIMRGIVGAVRGLEAFRAVLTVRSQSGHSQVTVRSTVRSQSGHVFCVYIVVSNKKLNICYY